MIDIKSRIRASEILEQVKKEELTNWQLEDQWPDSKTDPSLNCVLRWLWSLYDDDKEDKLFNVPFGDIKSLAFRRREVILDIASAMETLDAQLPHEFTQ